MTANAHIEWQPGDVILDQYEVISELGRGGMGKVYRVHHRGWNVDLAVKCPLPEYFASEREKENFIREAETWVNLQLHPHIVSCYYVRTIEDIPRIFAEYVAGRSLSDWIGSRRLYEGGHKQALERILDVAIQFAWGLDAVHEQGPVHQDVKPANVMMTIDGVAKVADFGLAKARAVAGKVLMTSAYASPEKTEGKELTHKTDIWSWGVSILEMFVGEVTWQFGTVVRHVLASHVACDGAIPVMPAMLVRLLNWCFEREPEKRPATMQEAAARLLEIYEQEVGHSYPREAPKSVRTVADRLTTLAQALCDGVQVEEAIQEWELALQTDPSSAVIVPERLTNLASTLYIGIRVEEEKQARGLAQQTDLHSAMVIADGLSNLAQTLYRYFGWATGLYDDVQVEEAMRLWRQELQSDPQRVRIIAGVLDNWAQTLYHSGQVEEAMQAWGPLPQADPQSARIVAATLNNRALSLYDLGKVEEAMQAWRQALQADPQHLETIYNRGVVLWRRGELNDDALLRQLERARARATQNERQLATYLLASIHVECGNVDAVRPLLEEVRLAPAATEFEALYKQVQRKPPLHYVLRTFQGSQDYSYSQGPMNQVTEVGLSADGRFALFVLYTSLKGSKHYWTLWLWEVNTGHCLQLLRKPQAIAAMSLSADGRFALAGYEDGTLHLWEVSTGRRLRTFRGHTGRVTSVCLSADGQFALAGYEDGTLELCETSTGRRLRTFQGSAASVSSTCLSVDGCLALSGNDDGTLHLWEVSTGSCLHTFNPAPPEHSDTDWRRVDAVCLSADGRFALSASDYRLYLWEVSTGSCLRTFQGLGSPFKRDLGLSADGCLALSASLDGLELWEMSTGRCLRTFQRTAASMISVCLSADGQFALAGCEDGTLELWEVVDTHYSCPLRLCRPWSHTDIARAEILLRQAEQAEQADRWEEALDLLRALRALPGYERSPESLQAWNRLALHCSHGEFRDAWLTLNVSREYTEKVRSICLSTDGRLALSGSYEGERALGESTLHLWDVNTGLRLRTFQYTGWMDAVNLSADMHLINSEYEGGTLELTGSQHRRVNLDASTPLRLVTDRHLALPRYNNEDGTFDPELYDLTGSRYQILFIGQVDALSLSADGRLALSVSRGKLHLWDVNTGLHLRTFSLEGGISSRVSLSVDWRFVLSRSNDNTLHLWDVNTGRRLRTFRGHTKKVSEGCLSVDGRFALFGYEDGTLEQWEMSTGRYLRTFQGHTSSITSICLSGNGRSALSGSDDGTLHLWEVSTGRCLHIFQGHTKKVISASLSADRHFALSMSDDNTQRLWDVGNGNCLYTFNEEMTLSPNGHHALSLSHNRLRLWELDLALQAHAPVDCDEGALPYLETFLTLHTPYMRDLPLDRKPSKQEIQEALTRRGKPLWNDQDFQELIRQLQYVGYGWLRPEGVQRKLEELAASWQEPPSLVGIPTHEDWASADQQVRKPTLWSRFLRRALRSS